MSLYPVLQSGFVAMSESGFKKSDLSQPTVRDVLLYHMPEKKTTHYFYHPQITELYLSYCASPEKLKDFDFREQIIKQAVAVFKGTTFYDWILLQSNKPTIGNLHREFIVQTLNYLLNDQAREIHLSQWIRLLETDIKAKLVPIEVSEIKTARIFPLKTTELLSLWLSKPKGYEDLLLSLFAMFGSRNQTTEVTEG